METETKPVNVLLPVDTIEKVKAYANKHGRKLASVHNSALLEYVRVPGAAKRKKAAK